MRSVIGIGFAVDAGVVKADANRQWGVPGTEADRAEESALSRPAREHPARDERRGGEFLTAKTAQNPRRMAKWLSRRASTEKAFAEMPA